MAPKSEFLDANLFDVESCGVAINYAKSSLTGDPRLSYTDKDRSLSFVGEEIRVEETEIGNLVTVTIDSTPDLETLTVTMLVPAVNVALGTPLEDFETLIIFTTHRTSIGGPYLVDGQLKTYKCMSVEGTAQHVLF